MARPLSMAISIALAAGVRAAPQALTASISGDPARALINSGTATTVNLAAGALLASVVLAALSFIVAFSICVCRCGLGFCGGYRSKRFGASERDTNSGSWRTLLYILAILLLGGAFALIYGGFMTNRGYQGATSGIEGSLGRIRSARDAAQALVTSTALETSAAGIVRSLTSRAVAMSGSASDAFAAYRSSANLSLYIVLAALALPALLCGLVALVAACTTRTGCIVFMVTIAGLFVPFYFVVAGTTAVMGAAAKVGCGLPAQVDAYAAAGFYPAQVLKEVQRGAPFQPVAFLLGNASEAAASVPAFADQLAAFPPAPAPALVPVTFRLAASYVTQVGMYAELAANEAAGLVDFVGAMQAELRRVPAVGTALADAAGRAKEAAVAFAVSAAGERDAVRASCAGFVEGQPLVDWAAAVKKGAVNVSALAWSGSWTQAFQCTAAPSAAGTYDVLLPILTPGYAASLMGPALDNARAALRSLPAEIAGNESAMAAAASGSCACIPRWPRTSECKAACGPQIAAYEAAAESVKSGRAAQAAAEATVAKLGGVQDDVAAFEAPNFAAPVRFFRLVLGETGAFSGQNLRAFEEAVTVSVCGDAWRGLVATCLAAFAVAVASLAALCLGTASINAFEARSEYQRFEDVVNYHASDFEHEFEPV